MFDWFNQLGLFLPLSHLKTKKESESELEDDCQELSSRATPPVTPEEAFHTWVTKTPPPALKELEDRKKYPT